MTDEALITAAAGGEEQAFAELLDGEYKRIYRYAYRWCGNVADAEDVTQLACIKLAKNIGQYRGESAFTTWLYRLVVNCAKDWQKSQARHLGNSEVSEEATSQDSNTQWIFLQQVLKLIETMGEDFKETALLVLAEGFSHREAGEMLGVKEGTISWRLHEIRRQLSSLDAKEGQ
jgi:RNA polymerase sigma-70 factor (ECF subfamily)